jgi:hypothetical protein
MTDRNLCPHGEIAQRIGRYERVAKKIRKAIRKPEHITYDDLVEMLQSLGVTGFAKLKPKRGSI